MEFNIHLIQNILQSLFHLLPLLQSLLFNPILSLHLIQIKHLLLIFLGLLTLTDLPRLAKLNFFEDIRNVFKNVHINILFLTAIQHVLAYFKFLKDLCTIKRTTQVRHDVFIPTSILNSGVVVKCGDPEPL